MKIIALTGHPMAQQAAELQLLALARNRGPEIHVQAGVASAAEARAVHASQGEVWHCGDDKPRLELSADIDRHVAGSNFGDVARAVTREFLRLNDQ
jgi:hypothetical protein